MTLLCLCPQLFFNSCCILFLLPSSIEAYCSWSQDAVVVRTDGRTKRQKDRQTERERIACVRIKWRRGKKGIIHIKLQLIKMHADPSCPYGEETQESQLEQVPRSRPEQTTATLSCIPATTGSHRRNHRIPETGCRGGVIICLASLLSGVHALPPWS